MTIKAHHIIRQICCGGDAAAEQNEDKYVDEGAFHDGIFGCLLRLVNRLSSDDKRA